LAPSPPLILSYFLPSFHLPLVRLFEGVGRSAMMSNDDEGEEAHCVGSGAV
jgi:hypothetical protein